MAGAPALGSARRPNTSAHPSTPAARQEVGILGGVWLVLGVLGIVAVVTRWLPAAEAVDIGVVRAGPILGFLVAVTVLAELADAAGVFDVAAAVCARWARGSTAMLFVLVAALATVVTIAMSLDTTAVLLTPVVLAVAGRLGLPPLPFAVLVVWLANTASLLLPVSNLTNLLARQHGALSTFEFARMMLLPAVVAVVITVVYLGVVFRRSLVGGYAVPAVALPPDRVRFVICAVACVGFAAAVAAGVVPWLAATVAAVPALVTFAVRDRAGLRWSLFPWRLVVTTEGLFLVVGALIQHGLGDLLTEWTAGSGARTVALAATLSNAINNLPAYLAVESAVPAGATHQLSGALIGTNCGPLITMWGSLATLLWAERCRARGVVIRPLTFAGIGVVGVPLVLVGTWAVAHG